MINSPSRRCAQTLRHVSQTLGLSVGTDCDAVHSISTFPASAFPGAAISIYDCMQPNIGALKSHKHDTQNSFGRNRILTTTAAAGRLPDETQFESQEGIKDIDYQ
jgi:hypothetical protein